MGHGPCRVGGYADHVFVHHMEPLHSQDGTPYSFTVSYAWCAVDRTVRQQHVGSNPFAKERITSRSPPSGGCHIPPAEGGLQSSADGGGACSGFEGVPASCRSAKGMLNRAYLRQPPLVPLARHLFVPHPPPRRPLARRQPAFSSSPVSATSLVLHPTRTQA